MRTAIASLLLLAACDQNVRYVQATPVMDVQSSTITSGPEE